jgi:hypothetical protein
MGKKGHVAEWLIDQAAMATIDEIAMNLPSASVDAASSL